MVAERAERLHHQPQRMPRRVVERGADRRIAGIGAGEPPVERNRQENPFLQLGKEALARRRPERQAFFSLATARRVVRSDPE